MASDCPRYPGALLQGEHAEREEDRTETSSLADGPQQPDAEGVESEAGIH